MISLAMDQIFRFVSAQSQPDKAVPDQPAQRVRNLAKEALVGRRISAARSAHRLSPSMITQIHKPYTGSGGYVLRRDKYFCDCRRPQSQRGEAAAVHNAGSNSISRATRSVMKTRSSKENAASYEAAEGEVMTKLMSLAAITLILSTAGAFAQHRHWGDARYGIHRVSPTVYSDVLSSGPYHRDVLPDGTVTGPLAPDISGGP